MNVESKLEEMNLTLPPPSPQGGVYQSMLLVGNHAHFSGHVPLLADGSMMKGRVGEDVDLAGAQAAAKQVGLCILATAKDKLGSLDRIQRVVKLFGMVNCSPDFTKHPLVINGCSELFRDIWGPDLGVGVRSAVGVGSLPINVSVEIEGVFLID
ncbi:MAG: RidA family protein [Opitutales bacterium]|jgi:enamine deaminase RidA (YjgF/YER057c/UK114 family)